MSSIFICYRRDDSAGHAGRLHDALVRRFGQDVVFMDISAIPPGQKFSKAIEDALGSCHVQLAVIGQQWVTITDPASGRRRLDDPKDYVRREIVTALERGILVIPVLVHGASVPKANHLPDDLKSLVDHQAHEITDRRWDFDVGQLIKELEKVVGDRTPSMPSSVGSGQAVGAGPRAPTAPEPRLRVSSGALARVQVALASAARGRASREAATVLAYLVLTYDPLDYVPYHTIEQAVNLHGVELDDALHELKDAFLIKPHAEAGNPFSLIEPRITAWARAGKNVLGFDVQADMLSVARAVNEQAPIDGAALQEKTKLPVNRINIAAMLLEARGLLDLLQTMGTSPYLFAEATPNYKTRQWLREQTTQSSPAPAAAPRTSGEEQKQGSTPEERYQSLLASMIFTCPVCHTQQSLPADLKAQHDQNLGTVHVIECLSCRYRYSVAFDRLDTVGVTSPDGQQSTKSLTWLMEVQGSGW